VAGLGPVGRQAEKIDRFLRDEASTGVLVTALPEEMPVNETIDFERSLDRELGMGVDRIVVNALHPKRFRSEEVSRLEAALREDAAKPARAALRAALSEHRRARAEHAQLRRLRRAARAPVATLPRVFQPELDRDDLMRLSAELERRL
jgi:hypothetical protein